MNEKRMNIDFPSGSEQDTNALAVKLARAVKPGFIIYMHGELGAGKTTFVRAFLRALGFEGKVKSPTYTIVEPYELSSVTINHFDLYRFEDDAELTQIGMDEYFTDESICIIEWPEKGGSGLPPADLGCYIDRVEDEEHTRQIRMTAYTKLGEEILARL